MLSRSANINHPAAGAIRVVDNSILSIRHLVKFFCRRQESPEGHRNVRMSQEREGVSSTQVYNWYDLKDPHQFLTGRTNLPHGFLQDPGT
ncbi:hypothetical protein J6590_102339 [Homalodisca vitripennis]|nr:hypothetical protein J6590_102339 [Homalodisca vitripennis]